MPILTFLIYMDAAASEVGSKEHLQCR